MLLSTLAFSASAVAGGFSAPGAGERLGAGRRVEVRWERVPRGIEEMELLVSLDGSHTFARVADLDPADVSFSWLVPSLPTEHAVLAIRGRINGHETLVVETDAFAIQPADGLGLHPLSYHGGELWTDAAGSSTPATDELAGRQRTFAATPAADQPAESSSRLDRVAPGLSTDEPATPAQLPAPALETSRSRSPLAFPQRK